MKMHGTLQRIELPFRAKRPTITLEVQASPEDLERFQGMDLDIKVQKHKDLRSLQANNMLWSCLGEMAKALKTDNWSMYLYELERYGVQSNIKIAAEAVPMMQKQFRATKVIDEYTTLDPDGNERKEVEMLCFYGSHLYTTEEFARLLDGTIQDMRDIGLAPPPTADVQQIIKGLEESERKQEERRRKAKEKADGKKD